jgi:hypothetical protein
MAKRYLSKRRVRKNTHKRSTHKRSTHKRRNHKRGRRMVGGISGKLAALLPEDFKSKIKSDLEVRQELPDHPLENRELPMNVKVYFVEDEESNTYPKNNFFQKIGLEIYPLNVEDFEKIYHKCKGEAGGHMNLTTDIASIGKFYIMTVEDSDGKIIGFLIFKIFENENKEFKVIKGIYLGTNWYGKFYIDQKSKEPKIRDESGSNPNSIYHQHTIDKNQRDYMYGLVAAELIIYVVKLLVENNDGCLAFMQKSHYDNRQRISNQQSYDSIYIKLGYEYVQQVTLPEFVPSVEGSEYTNIANNKSMDRGFWIYSTVYN